MTRHVGRRCAFRLPVRGRLRRAADRLDQPRHAVLHLEAGLGGEQLLRGRRQGPELQQRRRRGRSPGPGLRAAQHAQAHDLHRRDDLVLLGGAAGNRLRRPDAALRSTPSTRPKGTFQKQSLPPTLLSPSTVQAFFDQPTFRWTPTHGARRYRLQVSADPTFGNPLDDVITDATSYSTNTTYPADTVLYWRVRADDENLNGLTWSATGTFEKQLAAPVPSSSNPTQGDTLPVWSWAPVQGASSYDLAVDQPDGQHRDYSDIRTPAASFIKMTGTGVWHWRVRAEFPRTDRHDAGPVLGDCRRSPARSASPSTPRPTRPRTTSCSAGIRGSGSRTTRCRSPRARTSAASVETVTTDNPSYAPTMTQYGYTTSSTLYWHVAGVDEDRNQGDWSQAQQIQLLPRLRVSVSGLARHKHVEHGARDGDGRAGQAALRRQGAPHGRRHPGGRQEDEQDRPGRLQGASRRRRASCSSARRRPASRPPTER